MIHNYRSTHKVKDIHLYQEELPSFRMVQSSRPAASLAYILVVLFFTTIFVLIFVPWQQTSEGVGRIVAYAPLDRQQSVESPINGRIAKWHVKEGSRVQVGDPLLDITDNDPEFLERIRQERIALQSRLEATLERESYLRSRINALKSSQSNAITAASSRTMMASDRVRVAQQALDAAIAQERTAVLNLSRQKQLYEKGLTSKRNLELAELDFENARTGLSRAKATLDASKKEENALNADRSKVDMDGSASISDAKATLASTQSEIAKIQEEIPKIEARLSRQTNQNVLAPRNGTIVRILVNPDGQQVKEGDILCIIIPETDDRAVELYINGNDIPLISEGRDVRLQFQGWPVLQISGWPKFTVGTFGGVVSLVDVTDNGSGFFRILIVPNPEEEVWPSSRYLRQGVRVRGWIFLNRVSLGYELWRKFNDFPPMIPMDDPMLKERTGLPEGSTKSK
jgi:multidrug efflux pump subunit AcrA (membrane-fusion protein)